MLYAITREVSPSIADCELTYIARQSIDAVRASEQHSRYKALLGELGANVLALPPLPDCPDAVFVEDTCIVLDEVAIMAPMGAARRRRETEGLVDLLSCYRTVLDLGHTGTLDGGDVMQVGKTLYLGVSGRTNEQGCALLRRAVEPFGYAVVPVLTKNCLHLKTACMYLGRNLLLANPAWVDTEAMRDMEVIQTHPDEPFGANSLCVGDKLVYPAGFPRTKDRLERRGFSPRTVDVTELQKAEAGVTCMSILFKFAGEQTSVLKVT